MRILTRQEIEKLISMQDAIAVMEEVFKAVTEKKVHVPERTVITMEGSQNSILFMPGYIPGSKGVGLKIVSVFPSNAGKGIPTIAAQIVLCDAETGVVHTILEGATITALRTAATTAVATKYLARDDARNLGVFGAGVQARSQIEAHLALRQLKSILVFDPDSQKAEALAKDIRQVCGASCTCETATSPGDIPARCDLIITATTAQTPVFDGNLLKSGTHINAIGSYKPHVREVDDQTIRRSTIVVDSYFHALKEAGDLILPLERGVIQNDGIRAELGEVILGLKKGRDTADQITFFKCVGMAVQDIAIAQKVLERAERGQVGTVL